MTQPQHHKVHCLISDDVLEIPEGFKVHQNAADWKGGKVVRIIPTITSNFKTLKYSIGPPIMKGMKQVTFLVL